MRVSTLYPDNPLRGNDVYIVGSGPSLGVITKGYLKGRVCVTLNDAWKHSDAGPVAISNNRGFLEKCPLPIQVVKGRLRFDPNPERDDNHTPWDHPTYYVFSYRSRKHGDSRDHLDRDSLWKEDDYYWNEKDGSISIFGVQFAMLCGAKSITLVGCDCCQLNGMEYVKTKHRGAKVKHNYEAYARGLMRLAHEGWKRGVQVGSWVPFVGLGRHNEQYQEMSTWQK